MVSVLVRVENGSREDDLTTLTESLTGHDALRGHVQLARRAPQDGKMGPITDALIVAVGPGGAAGALAAGIAFWLRNRRPGPPATVVVKLELPDGSGVRVSAEGVDDPAAVVAAAVEPWITGR